jgi:tRNA(Ile)-lysidine synthase
VHSLAERVLPHIRRQELLRAGDRVGVAVSGGIDSVSLLRLLLELRGELGIVVSVVHFNHRLRGAESDADEEFVANLAREHDLEFYSDSDDVAERAAEDRVSVETAARELRYGFFFSLLGGGGDGDPQGLKPSSSIGPNGTAKAVPLHEPRLGAAEAAPFQGVHEDPFPSPTMVNSRLDKIATGHTLDDQAETVLMRIIRGSGLRGLGGIHPRLPVEDDAEDTSGEIIRPLLSIRHRELEQYLKDIAQPWREDSSNMDERFTRNRVRKLVLPLLEREFNPTVAENLAELAEIARGEEDYWENEVSGWLGTTVQWSPPAWARPATEGSLVQIASLGNKLGQAAQADSELQSRINDAPWLVANASVSRMWFLGEQVAVQRRLVKAIGGRAGIPLEFKHVEEILRVAAEGGPHSELSLPLGWKLILEPEDLIFATPDLRDPLPPRDYEYELPLAGRIAVYETGSSIEIRHIPDGAHAAYNADQLLDKESLPGPLRVRNWRPGDRFWPAHTKSPKKIKELLQELHVAQQERKLWPVVVSGDEIVWMRGFPTPANFGAQPERSAILIMEESLDAELST